MTSINAALVSTDHHSGWEIIVLNSTEKIAMNKQMVCFGAFTVDGTLIIDGALILEP